MAAPSPQLLAQLRRLGVPPEDPPTALAALAGTRWATRLLVDRWRDGSWRHVEWWGTPQPDRLHVESVIHRARRHLATEAWGEARVDLERAGALAPDHPELPRLKGGPGGGRGGGRGHGAPAPRDRARLRRGRPRGAGAGRVGRRPALRRYDSRARGA